MADLSVASSVLLSFAGRHSGQRVLNTFWYYVSVAPGTLTTQLAAFTALDAVISAGTNLSPKFIGAMPDNYVLEERWYQVIQPIRYVKYAFVANLPGTVGYEAFTPNTAASITRRSELGNRRAVGHLQVIAPTGGDPNTYNDGIIESAGTYKTALAALALQMIQNVTAGGYTFRPVVGPGLDGSGNARYLVGATVQDTVRTMHRRTVRLGE